MIYTIPALSQEDEFFDLAYVAKYVDRLLKSTGGDLDYGVVYEWIRDDCRDGPPDAVLMRVAGNWVRRAVLATSVPGMNRGWFTLSFADDQA